MMKAKRHGQFFTPPAVAATLVGWAVRNSADRILDPSCGDGAFLIAHENAVGCEIDPEHAATARTRAPRARVHVDDFFTWAGETAERFDAVVGNPPFIRYHGFSGEVRSRALHEATRFGARLPALTSSWAPFIAASARLLHPGGRLACVVPAEIGHALYAAPLIDALCAAFAEVVIVAVREKIFPRLAEDAWLLYAAGYGASTSGVRLVAVERFEDGCDVPSGGRRVTRAELEGARGRLRRWLAPADALDAYEACERSANTARLGTLATVNIGYVSGANTFFHLRPSVARKAGIDRRFFIPSVRRGASLPASRSLTTQHVDRWLEDDDQVMLLRLDRTEQLPPAVQAYLDTDAGEAARAAYKCRVRDPWWSVPDVSIPDGFLSYMSATEPALVANAADCSATNSVHVVNMRSGRFCDIQQAFRTPLARLSCELEGHPLGGGMLKIEPREAQRLLLPRVNCEVDNAALESGIAAMRAWRGIAVT